MHYHPTVISGVKHLNPRQGITTSGTRDNSGDQYPRGVKHLNPRQGITNTFVARGLPARTSPRVKHLNPRQGITIWQCGLHLRTSTTRECETPKSPPGDYNETMTDPLLTMVRLRCETPKSPPGDYNCAAPHGAHRPAGCETPKSPPGDYNYSEWYSHWRLACTYTGVKHLNPRQGITTLQAPRAWFPARVGSCVKHLNPRQGITTRSPAAQ